MAWDEGLAGAAARTMLAQDSRWFADAILSAQGSSGWLPLLLLGHGARIVYEGSIAVQSRNPSVGVPELARALDRDHADVIARSRHGGKFLDDSKRSFDDLRNEMSSFYDAHQTEFLGNAAWFARWLESDIGIVLGRKQRVLGTTITLHFRTGLDHSVPISEAGPILGSAAAALGRALAAFTSLGGDETPPIATIDYRVLGPPRNKDRRLNRYSERRYDPGMDVPTKLLTMMVEGDINTTAQVIAASGQSHPEATFRARMISVYHSLRAVDELLQMPGLTASDGTERVRRLLADQTVRRFIEDPGLRRLRNRCVHYEIRDQSIDLDQTRPMFGIVESLSSRSFDELDAELQSVTDRLGDALHTWQAPR